MIYKHIKTKTALIKLLDKIGQDKINQGIEIKRLSQSVEHFKDQRNTREWIEFCKNVLENSKYLDTDERRILEE